MPELLELYTPVTFWRFGSALHIQNDLITTETRDVRKYDVDETEEDGEDDDGEDTGCRVEPLFCLEQLL